MHTPISGLLAAALMLTALPATAQGIFDRPSERQGTTYDVGVAAGMIGGGGLSVRRWSETGHGLQLNFLPYYYEEKYPADGDGYFNERLTGSSYEGYLSLGFLYMKRVAEFSNIHVFPFAGGSYSAIFEGGTYTEEVGGGAVTRSGSERHGDAALGGGMGASIATWRLEASVMLGLRAAYDLHKETRSLTPSIDLGLHFRL